GVAAMPSVFFFFSSRRRHTRFSRDWSSDVCSSDLLAADRPIHLLSFEKAEDWADADARARVQARMDADGIHWHPRRYHKRPSARSEERRVGQERSLRWVTRTRAAIGCRQALWAEVA